MEVESITQVSYTQEDYQDETEWYYDHEYVDYAGNPPEYYLEINEDLPGLRQ